MSDLAAKREEIAALIARELGLGELGSLDPAERETVERRTDETIAGCGEPGTGAGDHAQASAGLQRLLVEYRGLKTLRADEGNVVLAEQGEVFSPEDDA